LTSVAANLVALGAGRPVLPAVTARLAGRRLGVTLAAAGASGVPRFGYAGHLASLAADPPAWPVPTSAASLLAFDLVVPRAGFGQMLPAQHVRLELLDYPGEWLLDLPLLRTGFAEWSNQVLQRLEGREEAAAFLAFAIALAAGAPADEALAATGYRLYREALQRLRNAGLSLLQPGRFLMPPPGDAPPWMAFFPYRGSGALGGLLARRYDAYVAAVERDLAEPLFGSLDRMVVLVDVLSALHRGQAAFDDMQAALASLARLRLPPRVISRVVFAASKADHVGERQRENLASLLRRIVEPVAAVPATYLPVASIVCTEDTVMRLGDRAVSAVVGHQVGERARAKSYPGEVPSSPPDARFWAEPFYALPNFQPVRLPLEGRAGVPNLNLDAVLLALLDDVL
jgi:predicted YcjX-like family ATPase